MPRKAEISVKWLESKDAGKIYSVNVKHVIGRKDHGGERDRQDKGKDPKKKKTAEKVYATCNIIESKLIILIFLSYYCLLQQKDTLARKWIPFFWL